MSAAASSKRSASLPPGLMVRTVKFVWSRLWHTMMVRLAPSSQSGEYVRPESAFRGRLPAEPVAGRYWLVVGLGCPWAHRTLVARSLKGLESALPVARVSPSPDQGIWVFEQPFEGCATLPQLYQLAQPGYSGRATVPVLWDSLSRTIINNESADIIEILNDSFNALAAQPQLDLAPAPLKADIERWDQRIYAAVNNGVYRCGFAQSQAAYDTACAELFAALDEIEAALCDRRYLCGDRPTLADVRLFTTLFRFDAVYYGLFKCNRRRIQDYPNLGPYLRDLYQLPGVAATCDLEAVKRDYYGNLFPLNPGGIIPSGPEQADLDQPHQRQALATSAEQPS